MNFTDLLYDIESRMASERIQDIAHEAQELAIAEMGSVVWLDRLRGSQGPVQVLLPGGIRITGHVHEVADEWFVLVSDDVRRQTTVISAKSVVAMRNLARHVVPQPAGVWHTLSWRHILRGVARTQEPLRVVTAAGILDCIITRVMGDHIDVMHRDAESIQLEGGQPLIEAIMLHSVLAFEFSSQ